jgi:hypothetical protein
MAKTNKNTLPHHSRICFVMVFLDILLAMGAYNRMTVLLIVWQIGMMLYIILGSIWAENFSDNFSSS